MWKALLLVLVLGSGAARADDQHGNTEHADESGPVDLGSYVEGAQALEGRIIAPCCFVQTIDVHGSPLSTALRKEIRERLRAGESSTAIEQSLVLRYGPRVLVEPAGGPLQEVGIALSLAMLGLGGFGYFLLRRWRRATAATRMLAAGAGEAPSRDRDLLDLRIDSEISTLGGDDN